MEIDLESGCISLAALSIETAKQAKSADSQHAIKDSKTLKQEIKALQALPLKFWIKKEEALKRLIAFGPKVEPALEIVKEYLKHSHHLLVVRIFSLTSSASKKNNSAIIELLGSKSYDDVAVAAQVNAHLSITCGHDAVKDVVPVLRRILERKHFVCDSYITGVKCSAAIAPFALREMVVIKVQILFVSMRRDHLVILHFFPQQITWRRF